jgi:hypothetical protein
VLLRKPNLMCRSDLDFPLSISNSHVQQSAYSSSSKMRARRIIALGYMMDDGAPVQRDSLVVTAQRLRIFSSVSLRLNVLIDKVPCRCLYKHEIILKAALVRCLASELSSSFLFACFHSTLVAPTSISRRQDGIGQQKLARS